MLPEKTKEKLFSDLLAHGYTRDTSMPLSTSVVPAAAIKKMNRLELTDSLDVLPRNLGVLLNVRSNESSGIA